MPRGRDPGAMTTLDWLIVVFAALGAISGAMRGFVAGALSLAGFVGGAFAGARLAPLLLSGGSASPYAPLFALIGALRARHRAGRAPTGRRRRGDGRCPDPGRTHRGRRARRAARSGDRAHAGLGGGRGGAAHAGCRLAADRRAALLDPPGTQRRTATVRAAPPRARALRPAPRDRRARAGGDRGAVSGGAQPARRAAPRSTGRRVLAAACGLGISGSGWIARRGVIVTNAHVVAGTEGDVSVQLRGTGTKRDAARRLLRPARRHRAPGGPAGRGLTAAHRRRPAVRHRRRDPRLSGERPVRLPRRTHRSDPAGLLAGHLRERPDPPHDDLDPRPGYVMKLRRARRRQRGARARDGLRLGRGHVRQGRFRRAERARPLGARARGRRIAERFDRRVCGLSSRAEEFGPGFAGAGHGYGRARGRRGGRSVRRSRTPTPEQARRRRAVAGLAVVALLAGLLTSVLGGSGDDGDAATTRAVDGGSRCAAATAGGAGVSSRSGGSSPPTARYAIRSSGRSASACSARRSPGCAARPSRTPGGRAPCCPRSS